MPYFIPGLLAATTLRPQNTNIREATATCHPTQIAWGSEIKKQSVGGNTFENLALSLSAVYCREGWPVNEQCPLQQQCVLEGAKKEERRRREEGREGRQTDRHTPRA